jgi:hypothetical protein
MGCPFCSDHRQIIIVFVVGIKQKTQYICTYIYIYILYIYIYIYICGNKCDWPVVETLPMSIADCNFFFGFRRSELC